MSGIDIHIKIYLFCILIFLKLLYPAFDYSDLERDEDYQSKHVDAHNRFESVINKIQDSKTDNDITKKCHCIARIVSIGIY
jgi:hypothetical protein